MTTDATLQISLDGQPKREQRYVTLERHEAQIATYEEALRQIIAATKDYDAPNWYIAMEVIAELARTALDYGGKP
jgi:hypothetical protein